MPDNYITKQYLIDNLKNFKAEILDDEYAPIDSPTLTGTPSAPDVNDASSSSRIATVNYVQDAIGQISGFSIEEVDSFEELPSVGSAGTIYRIPKTDGTGHDLYDEYYYISNGESSGFYEALGDVVPGVATQSSKGLMSSTDKTKLDTTCVVKDMTLAQYAALSNEKKMDGTVYLITDSPATSADVCSGVGLSATGSNITNVIKFGVNAEGKYGYYPPGADTLIPFSSGGGTILPGLYIDPIMAEIMEGVINND